MVTEGKRFHIFFTLWVGGRSSSVIAVALLLLPWHPCQHCCMARLRYCAPGNFVQGTALVSVIFITPT